MAVTFASALPHLGNRAFRKIGVENASLSPACRRCMNEVAPTSDRMIMDKRRKNLLLAGAIALLAASLYAYSIISTIYSAAHP